MNKQLEKCRFCEHFDSYEDTTWGNMRETFMCYEYRDSNDCGIDYISKCYKFTLCEDLREMIDNELQYASSK